MTVTGLGKIRNILHLSNDWTSRRMRAIVLLFMYYGGSAVGAKEFSSIKGILRNNPTYL